MKKSRSWLFFVLLAVALAFISPLRAATFQLTPERTGHAATTLLSGKILITGGVNESATLNSALLYDPATGQLTPTGSMTTARADHSSTLLAEGRVLIAGGDQGR